MVQGDYIKQNRIDEVCFAIVLNKLKNGGFKVIAYDTWRNRAFCSSTKNWYPAPVIIDKSEVPEKAIAKIEKHMVTLLNRA